MKKLILLNIMLLILMIGAVSAANNTTVDDETAELNITTDGENVLKENWDIQVDEYIEALPAENQIIDIDNYPNDAEGNISLSIDGVEQNLLKGFYYNHYGVDEWFQESTARWTFNATNISFGQHDYTLNFSGDGKYAPSTKSGILNISPMIFDIPSNITLWGTSYTDTKDYGLWDDKADITIKYLKGIEGNIYLYMNGKKNIINLTDFDATGRMNDRYDNWDYKLINLDRSEEFYVYRNSIYFNKPTNLTVIYNGDSININRSYFVNVTYNLDCEDEMMKGNDLEIYIPKSISSKISVKIDGKKVKFYSSRVVLDYEYIRFYAKTSSLNYGNHTIKINFKGNKNCPARSITKTFTVIHQPTLSPKTIKMYYTDSVTCSLTVYGTDGKALGKGYKIYIWTDYDCDKTEKVTKTNKNGKITYKIPKNLKPGTHSITVLNYELDIEIKAKLIVKHIVTLKEAMVKKSAKKLVLTATLKNKKPITGKTVTFKFNGKTYKGKTNSKGIAKVTVPKSVLKKLKAGKKITYQATYLKDTVKKTVTIQK